MARIALICNTPGSFMVFREALLEGLVDCNHDVIGVFPSADSYSSSKPEKSRLNQ